MSSSAVPFHVGDIIRALRLARRLTLHDLAEQSRVPRHTLFALESDGPDSTAVHLSDLLACVKTLDFDLYAAYAALEKDRYRDRPTVATRRLELVPFIDPTNPTATLTLTLDQEFRLQSAKILQPHLTMFGQSRLDVYLGGSAWRKMIGEPFMGEIEKRVRACFKGKREQTITYERVLQWSAGRAYPHELRFTYDAATACVTATSYVMPTTAGQPVEFVCCREYANCVECFVAQGGWKMTRPATQQTG